MSDCTPASSDQQPEIRNKEGERKATPPLAARERTLEEELEEVRAVIDEHWDEMEESMRYLADR